MLVLTRRIGETLYVGQKGRKEEILAKVHILGSKGNQIRIGIEAPEDVWVHRKEIFEKINDPSDNSEEEVILVKTSSKNVDKDS